MTRTKQKKPMGLFDYEEKLEMIGSRMNNLEKLNQVIPWEMFRDILNQVFRKKGKGPGGASHYDYVFMFKIMVLQRFYGMSDEQTEFQIQDRLSFQHFLCITIADDVPDQNTIREFRERLVEAKAVRKLFRKFDNYLDKKGVVGNEGVIVDATFVDVPRQRNSRDENGKIKKGEVPEEWKDNPAMLRQKDTEARWITKNREKHFGYKNHIKADKRSKIIRNYETSTANVHDSQVIEKLIERRDRNKKLWADSAYSGEELQKRLADCYGMKPRIIEKAARNRPLKESEKKANRAKSSIRVRVEHIFGFLTNSMKAMFIRTIGRLRADGINGLNNLVYNMCRYWQINRYKRAS